MIYLFFLKENAAPTQDQMRLFSDAYRQKYGATDITLLGGTKTVGSLPTSPDSYVIALCLMLCDRNHIAFDNDKDQIAYSQQFDPSNLEDVGICQIIINK